MLCNICSLTCFLYPSSFFPLFDVNCHPFSVFIHIILTKIARTISEMGPLQNLLNIPCCVHVNNKILLS